MGPAKNIGKLIKKLHITPSVQMHKRTLTAVLKAHAETQKTKMASEQPNIGRIIMKSRITKLAVAAVIIIAVLISTYLFNGSVDVSSVAWADVLMNMEAAQTVTFMFESEKQYEDGEYCREKGTIIIKGPYRRIDGISSHRYQDGPFHEDTITSIIDLSRQNRFVLLHPLQKWAYYAPDHGGNDSLLTYDGLKKDFRDGTEEYLGKVQIDDLDTICFKVSKDDKEITVWADPDTALPIRIERTATEGIDKTILSNITFEIELDDEHFDMSLPEDYVVVNMKTEEFRIPFELTEEHLIEGLAKNARSLGGKFPTLYMGGRPGKEAFDKHLVETKTAVPMEGHGSGMLAAEYVKRLPEGSEWQYIGEDVKLGNSNTPVFWYRTPESKTCRVIYGDLTIKDIAPEDLPQAPWPPKRK
jgi:outer membrane lipoprotein-sorting protein